MDFSRTKIKHIVIHESGCAMRGEGITFGTPLKLDKDSEKTFLNFFLVDILKAQTKAREIYTDSVTGELCREILLGGDFCSVSEKIMEEYHEQSNILKVIKGKLIIVHLEDVCIQRHRYQDAIGIYRLEKKSKMITHDNQIKYEYSLDNIELGALIVGYSVLVHDGRKEIFSDDSYYTYWEERFLKVSRTR